MKRRTKKELNEFARSIGIEFPVGITKTMANNAYAGGTSRVKNRKMCIGYDWCKSLSDGELARVMFHEECHLLLCEHPYCNDTPLRWREELMCDIYAMGRNISLGNTIDDCLKPPSGFCYKTHPSNNTRNNLVRVVYDHMKSGATGRITLRYRVPRCFVSNEIHFSYRGQRFFHGTRFGYKILRVMEWVKGKLYFDRPKRCSFEVEISDSGISFPGHTFVPMGDKNRIC